MAAKTCKRFYESYDPSFAFGLLNSTFFRFISLFKDFNKLFKSLILFKYLIFALIAIFLAPSIAKYIKKNPKRIFKIILKR